MSEAQVGTPLDVVAGHWPPLDDHELAWVLERYPDAGSFVRRLTRSHRPLSAASVVLTDRGELFVKRHHADVRSAPQLADEHRFIDHLRARGVPAPAVFRSADGGTAVEDGRWTYEVHSVPPGEDTYRDAHSWTPFVRREHARAAGRALARLHIAAEGFDRPPRPPQPLRSQLRVFGPGDPRLALDELLAERPAIAEFLERRPWRRDLEVHLRFHERLAPYLDGVPAWWTHNDWHSSNLLWSGQDVAAVIDFGLADRTLRIYDLAVAVERNTLPWLDLLAGGASTVRTDQIEAILDGYEGEFPLTPRERLALVELLPLVQAEFALSELDYFWGAERSEAKAAWAYDTFFVRHTSWFLGAPGQELLGTLRDRAAAPS